MAKITIDKTREYDFKLEIGQTVELDNFNEIQYCYTVLFIDTKTNEKVEAVHKANCPLYFIRDNRYIFIIYRQPKNIYNAIYKKLEKACPELAKSMKKANQDIYLSISKSDYEVLNNAYHTDIEKLKNELLTEFNQKGILLEFYPDRINADGNIVYLSDSYKLSSQNENLLEFLFNMDSDKIVEKVFNYCQKYNLFDSIKKQSRYDSDIIDVKSILLTQELLEIALGYVTDNEMQFKNCFEMLCYLQSIFNNGDLQSIANKNDVLYSEEIKNRRLENEKESFYLSVN